MAKLSLKLLFLRKYRTSKKFIRQLKSSRPHFPATPAIDREGQENANFVCHTNGNSTVGRRRRVKQNNSSVDTVDYCRLIYDCIAHNKLKTFVFVIAVGFMSTAGLYYHNQRFLQYRVDKGDLFSPEHGIRLKHCSLPNLTPFSSEVQPLIVYSVRPNCANEQPHKFSKFPPFMVKNGSWLLRNIDENQSTGCCYRPFYRNGDNKFRISEKCNDISKNASTFIPVEYIEILCIDPATGTDFRDGFALIPRKEQVEKRIRAHEELSRSKNSLSVVILGLDATSRMNFLRTLPKSNEYLMKNLSAISLNGYTKVAENTLPNVVPLLTGRTLDEFKKKCVDEKRTPSYRIHLDECPFIWKKFATNGYRTSLAEDDVDIGVFNMNWPSAFVKPPTDYYLRPFSILMQRRHSFKKGFCYGPSLSFEKLLENIRSMAEVFHKQHYFQFTWSTMLSHTDYNKLRWGDQPLLELLKKLHSTSSLNNTALFIIGDHGSRIEKIRNTSQGKIEDRMPVAYIVLPEWFRIKYPKAYSNLQINSERITSAFDIHKTLYEFINLDNLQRFENEVMPEDDEQLRLPNNETLFLGRFRGSSLFHRFPRNRTCFAAGVSLHWCVCHKKIPQDANSEIAKDAARFIVESINALLHGQTCATLTLESVNEVSKWDPGEILREGCDYDNTSSISAACNTTDLIVLQVAFSTSPSKATFETTVIKLNNGKWKVTEDVVRTNSYKGQSYCVEQKFKPYCYCSEDSETILDGLF